MEHLQHFGLRQDPFSNEPDLRYFFESGSHRDAQRRVERSLRQRKGLTLLTGEGGMGKSLLARRILESLEEEVFEATLLVMHPGAADATGVLQRFARQIGCDEPDEDRGGLLGQIYEHLAIVREDGRHAVLMVDDAQIMTPEAFAELGGLLNLEYEDRRLVSMLLVGSPELDVMVQNDASIMPRVDVRVRIQPLDLPNAAAYIEHRLTSVEGNPALVPADVLEVLHKFGRGRPRLLNTLADNALFEAYLGGRTQLEASDIDRAAADLGIGPDPGSTYSQLSMSAGDVLPPPPVAQAQPAMGPAAAAALAAVDMDLEPDVVSASMSMDLEMDADADLDVGAGVETEGLGEAAEPDPAPAPAPVAAGLETALAGDEAMIEPVPAETPMAALLAVDELEGVADVADEALDFDEPLADFELTPDMETSASGGGGVGAVPTTAVELDLAAAKPDLGAAEDVIEDFGHSGSQATGAPAMELEALEFETDPDALADADAFVVEAGVEAEPVLEEDALFGGDATEAIEATPEFELAEAELSPLGSSDAVELDDAFVELLEE